MNKKIIAAICLPTLLTLPQNMICAEETLSSQATVLKELNILTEEKITQESFIYSLAAFLYDEPTKLGSASEIALSTGMISSEDEYNGKKSITVEDALKYAAITLGYKEDYAKTALDLNLSHGVEAAMSKKLKYDDAVTILYNLSEAEPLEAYWKSEDDMGYRVLADTTLLEQNRDIYKVKGIVTADVYTSIYGEEGTGNDKYIRLDDNEYIVNDIQAEDFLGLNVICYAKEEKNSEPEILCMTENENKNDVVTLDADKIEYVAEDFSYIEYMKENSDKTYKLKLPSALRVIYNGVYYGDYTAEDLTPNIGSLKFIDNNSDGKYEIISVKSYETMIVESVNKNEKKIINKYRFDGAVSELETEDDSFCKIYDAENNETNFDAIKTNDVLSVAKSKNTDGRVIRIYISGYTPFEGTVSGINYEDDEISIDGQTYAMSNDYLEFLNYDGKTNEMGKKYIFYRDCFGNTAYRKTISENDYFFVLKIYEEDEKYYVVYMDMDNEWYTSTFAKKVKFEGEKCDASVAYIMMGTVRPQIMKLEFNTANEIKSLDMAETVNGYAENKFTQTASATYAYRKDPRSFNMEIHLEDGANLLVCEEENSTNKERYYFRDAAGYFKADKSYSIIAYDVDRFGFSSLFSIVETAAISAYATNSSMFVVTGSGQVCSSDDEVLPYIVGNIGDYMNLTVIGANQNVFDGIKAGDVLNIRLNSVGKANYVTKIFSMAEFKPVSSSNMYNSTVNIAGTVEDLDLEAGKIKINCGDRYATLRLNTSKATHFYDPDRNTCEGKTAADIRIGDKILCSVSYGTISQIVCTEG